MEDRFVIALPLVLEDLERGARDTVGPTAHMKAVRAV